MDKHYLTPLFSPDSIAVFAGRLDEPDSQSAQARILLSTLRAQRFSGSLVFIDVHASGTLADLADAQADLALIALPADQVATALELAGRIKCRAALVISSGTTAAQALELQKIARRDKIHLLGPNCLGFQRPHLHLNASIAGPLAAAGPLALV